MAAPADRWLPLEGLDNLRDVGGLPLLAGGVTRRGVLLRSAELRFSTPAAITHLVDVFGLRLVLDLRTQREIDRAASPDVFSRNGVETVPLSFIPEEGRTLPETDDETDRLTQTYLGYLRDRPENVVMAVRRFAAAAGPALAHCTAGKDRTGVFVALVLDSVGTERAAVVADYVLSGERIEALFRRWTTASGEPMPADLTRHVPRGEAMTAVLAHLDAAHGGAAGWLRANGLDEDSLDRLRIKLC